MVRLAYSGTSTDMLQVGYRVFRLRAFCACGQSTSATTMWLAPGGRALFLLDWPKYGDVSVTDRLRATVGDGVPLDVLVLRGVPKSLDEHVTHYGVMLSPTLGAQFEDQVFAHREHMDRMQIRELRLALIVLRRTQNKPWTRLIETRAMAEVEPTGAQSGVARSLLRSVTVEPRACDCRIAWGHVDCRPSVPPSAANALDTRHPGARG